MEPLEFEYDSLPLRLDRGVFELFDFPYSSGFRVPESRLAVRVDYKKPDRGRIRFGTVRDAGVPVYATTADGLRFTLTPTTVVPAADERLFREYFTLVAARVGRTVGD